MQLETTLQSDPNIEVVVVFKYIPAQPMYPDCPAMDAEIDFYSVNFAGKDIYYGLKDDDFKALEDECMEYAKEVEAEKKMYNEYC